MTSFVAVSLLLNFCDPMFDIGPEEKLTLSGEKVQLLFQSCEYEKSEELTDLIDWSKRYDVYELDGGRILMYRTRPKKGYLYGSRESFEEAISQYKDGVNLANAFQPFQCSIFHDGFTETIPKGIEAFKRTFSLSDDSLDYSLESLKKVDEVLKKADQETLARSYINAISYMGEVIRKKVKGSEWKMIPSEIEKNKCVPAIVKGDKKYDPFIPYYESILEKRPSLYDAAYIELNRYSLKNK